jgi:oligoribonuclease NrnB/cAMP/cGMP phosphodiesterase (DHH superfamily)
MKTTQNKKAAVFYHRADLDGLMSGVIAKYYLSPRYDEITLIGGDYGDDFIKELNNVTNPDELESIYVIDLSDKALFEKYGDKIVWIDHHISAINSMPRVRDQYTIDGVAACRLAFAYFTNINYPFFDISHYVNRENPVEPWVVQMAGEYDIWDKKSPLARRFNFGIETKLEVVESIFRDTKGILNPGNKSLDVLFLEKNKDVDDLYTNYSLIDYIIKKGEGAIEHIRQTEFKCKGIPVEILGMSGISFNTHISSSLIAEISAQSYDFVMVWNYRGDNRVKCSFYSEKVDCSKIAVSLGGGGHKGAAGATIHIGDLLKILKIQF